MNSENQNEGSANPSPSGSKIDSGTDHIRKAAEDFKSVAGAMAGEYRGKAEDVWNDASQRVRSFQDDAEEYVRENPTKAIFTALGVGFVMGLIFRR
jgi:ElaB/YqjD/DUF883 family membrane-anchored ribosome-binding protein